MRVSGKSISQRTKIPLPTVPEGSARNRARTVWALLTSGLGACVLLGLTLLLSAQVAAAPSIGNTPGNDASSAVHQEFDDAWTRRVQLTFTNTEQTEDLLGFPILVVLNSSRIDYTACQSVGQDIRFVDSDGETVLSHEIEQWDESGTSYIWVKVPQIDGGSDADFVWMYYGNPDASDGQDPAGVWNEGYRMVYHLDENTEPSGGTIRDSTNRFDGTNRGATSVQGYIAGAKAFDGVNQWIDLGTNLPIINQVTATTLSAWLLPYAPSRNGDIIALSRNNSGNPTGNSRASLVQSGANMEVYARSTNDDSDWNHIPTTSSPVSEVDWHHVAAVVDYEHDAVTIYVDGVQQPTDGLVAFTNTATPDTNSENSALGSNDDGASSYFYGVIDEARVVAVGRTSDWIAAQYLTTSDAFISFGREEDVGLPVLGLDVWTSQEQVFPGARLDYSLLISNTGGRALHLVVSDTLPAQTAYVGCNCSHAGWTVPATMLSTGAGCGAAFSCFLDGDQVVWQVDQLESRQILQMTFQVVVDSGLEGGTMIVNDGYAMAADRLAPINISKPVTVTVRDLAVSISATASPNPVRLGQRLHYSFTVRNDSGMLQGITVTDSLPNDVSFVSCDGALCELGVEGREVRWWVPSLPNASDLQLSMDVVVKSDESDTIINQFYGVWVPEAARSVMGAPVSVDVQNRQSWTHFLNLPSMFGGALP